MAGGKGKKLNSKQQSSKSGWTDFDESGTAGTLNLSNLADKFSKNMTRQTWDQLVTTARDMKPKYDGWSKMVKSNGSGVTNKSDQILGTDAKNFTTHFQHTITNTLNKPDFDKATLRLAKQAIAISSSLNHIASSLCNTTTDGDDGRQIGRISYCCGRIIEINEGLERLCTEVADGKATAETFTGHSRLTILPPKVLRKHGRRGAP